MYFHVSLSWSPNDRTEVVDEAVVDDLLDRAGSLTVSAAELRGNRLTLQVLVEASGVRSAIDAALDQGQLVSPPGWVLVGVDAVTDEDMQLFVQEPNYPELVGTAEAAEFLGVSKQRVSQLLQQNADFPQPLHRLAAGPIWMKSAVDLFASTWDRSPGRRSARTAGKNSERVVRQAHVSPAEPSNERGLLSGDTAEELSDSVATAAADRDV